MTGELRDAGRPVPLQQQPFKLLEALLERPGELVTRETLRQRLWAEGTFVAFDRGLTSAMRKVREALGDHADTPVYIETLPGRGYRFIAPVAFGCQASPSTSAASRMFAAPRRLAWIAALLLMGIATSGRNPRPAIADDRLDAALSLSSYACRLKSEGRFAEALTVMRQAHALAPQSARLTAEVGLFLHAAGQYDAEMPMLRRAVTLDARSVDAWLHLGLGHARRSDFAEAISALERARILAPGDRRVVHWLAWARTTAGA